MAGILRYMKGGDKLLLAKRKAEETCAANKRIRDKEYETTKRKRLFLETWKTGRPWLVYDEEQNVMKCTVCLKYQELADKTSKFAQENGCDNFKLQSILRHESSSRHERCWAKHLAAIAKPGTSQAEKALRSMDVANYARVEKLFITCHGLAKNRQAFTSLPWLCDIQEMNGVDLGNNYRSDKQCREFCHYIAEVERVQLIKKYQESKFISVVVDGSTDSSVTEQELVYIRTATHGQLSVNFLTVAETEKANAFGIHSAIMKCALLELETTKDEFMSKLVALGTDGAAVMVGAKGGLVALMKKDQPCLIGIHCLAHRLELAFKKAVQKFTVFKEVDKVLLDLYMLYHYSALNRSMLKRSYSALGKTPLIPTRVGGTRWVSHLLRALEHVFVGYEAIVTHLEQASHGGSEVSAKTANTAKGLLKKIKKKDFILYGHFMWDILNILSVLSKTLQLKKLTLSEVHVAVTGAKVNLEKLHAKNGRKLKEVLGVSTFENITLSDTTTGFPETKERFLNDLQALFGDRFSDVEEGLLKATDILNISGWPFGNDSEGEIQDYGDDQVEVLVDHFKPILTTAGVNVDLIEHEWTLLKAEVFSKRSSSTADITWHDVHIMVDNKCNNMMSLVNLLLTLPASSAVCEQGFSELKKVKSDWRSRLTNQALVDQMRIIIESPSIADYKPAAAIQRWQCGGMRTRRPGVTPYKRKQTEMVDSDDLSSSSGSDTD